MELAVFEADAEENNVLFIGAARLVFAALREAWAETERVRRSRFEYTTPEADALGAQPYLMERVRELEADLARVTKERDEARDTAERFRQSMYVVEERCTEVARERDASEKLYQETVTECHRLVDSARKHFTNDAYERAAKECEALANSYKVDAARSRAAAAKCARRIRALKGGGT